MNKPHKHASLIKAWADGAEIQYRWEHLSDWASITTPIWDQDGEYRIKPEPKPDVVCKVVFSVYGNDHLCYHYIGQGQPNIKLTFDGETRKLKAAEVIA